MATAGFATIGSINDEERTHAFQRTAKHSYRGRRVAHRFGESSDLVWQGSTDRPKSTRNLHHRQPREVLENSGVTPDVTSRPSPAFTLGTRITDFWCVSRP